MKKRRRCPSCGKHELRQHTTHKGTAACWTSDVVCLFCGRRFVVVHQVYEVGKRGEGGTALAKEFASREEA